MPYRAPTDEPTHPILVVAYRGRVLGVDTTSGRPVWKYVVGGAYGDLVKIWVSRERVIAVANPRLAALDYLTGHEYWHADVGAVSSTLLVAGERIFVAGDGQTKCFTTDGELLWSERFMTSPSGPFSLGVPGRVVHD